MKKAVNSIDKVFASHSYKLTKVNRSMISKFHGVLWIDVEFHHYSLPTYADITKK